jgi:hypothetical protein
LDPWGGTRAAVVDGLIHAADQDVRKRPVAEVRRPDAEALRDDAADA